MLLQASKSASSSANVSPPKPPPAKLSPSDFLFGRTLGEGSYARVVHARFKKSSSSISRDYALKIMEKRHIKREDKVKYVMMEKALLSSFSSAFILSLHMSFQDDTYLYMVMDLCPGGELLNVIKHYKLESGQDVSSPCCPEPVVKYYTASVVCALEYLHQRGVVHRDLKPENVLLMSDGKVKLGDFGTALDLEGFANKGRRSGQEERKAFVGTAEYVSPEVLEGINDATPGVDLWALGCIIYQMIVGTAPFVRETEYGETDKL